MSRRTLTFVAINGGVDFLATGYKLSEVFDAAGVGAVWSKVHAAWLLYARDVPDVVAAAEHRGILVRGVEKGQRVGQMPTAVGSSKLSNALDSFADELPTAVDSSEQLDLLEGA